MENQEYIKKLEFCRKNIDFIDEEILKLLEKRLQEVEKVRKIKENNSEKFFIKSAREADMMKNLLKKTKIAKPIIIDIWRKIITSSNMLEQPIEIALYNPSKITDFKYIIQKYYADFIEITNYENILDLVKNISKNKAQIAVFDISKKEEIIKNAWWIEIARNFAELKIFTKIPFLPQNENNLVALAIKNAEKSSLDTSFLCVQADKNTSKSQLLQEFAAKSINAQLLQISQLENDQNSLFHLIEIDGFFSENIQEITPKNALFAKILGNCPKIT